MNKNTKKGVLCAVISALVFGITPVLASMTFEMGSNAMTLTFYRNALAVPVLLVVLLYRRENLKISLRDFAVLFLVSGLFSVSTTYLVYASYDNAPFSLSGFYGAPWLGAVQKETRQI